jgi:hypothetical protein
MEMPHFTLLKLFSSLQYIRSVSQDPSTLKHEWQNKENKEILFCYEVNPVQGSSIEPDRDRFLGKLLFIGEKTQEAKSVSAEENSVVSLPQGNYLFSQSRADTVLTRDEWLDLAIEQQKDGLWGRYKPLNLIYVRFLFEDDAFVTQVLRVIEALQP